MFASEMSKEEKEREEEEEKEEGERENDEEEEGKCIADDVLQEIDEEEEEEEERMSMFFCCLSKTKCPPTPTRTKAKAVAVSIFCAILTLIIFCSLYSFLISLIYSPSQCPAQLVIPQTMRVKERERSDRERGEMGRRESNCSSLYDYRIMGSHNRSPLSFLVLFYSLLLYFLLFHSILDVFFFSSPSVIIWSQR